MNESTVRVFKTRYYKELKQVTKEQREVSKCIPRYFQPTGRPLTLDIIDGMVQTYLRTLFKRGGVIIIVLANATAKAFISKYPNAAANVDIESSRWSRMNFVKRWKPSTKVETPEKARKKIDLLFLQDTVLSTISHQRLLST